jgi:hypothetical protein
MTRAIGLNTNRRPNTSVKPTRSVVAAPTASKSTKASARNPAAAKAKTSNSPSAGRGSKEG